MTITHSSELLTASPRQSLALALPAAESARLGRDLGRISLPLWMLQHGETGSITWSTGPEPALRPAQSPDASHLLAYLPAYPLERLGDPSFCRDHGIRYAYATGAMANGIASAEMVRAIAQAGMLGFFGSAGLSPARVEAAIDYLERHVPGKPFGFNLIHTPNEPDLEGAVVELYLRRGIRLVEASAYMDLTLPLVRYRVAGLEAGPDGQVIARNQVVAKVSRVEVATRFFSPPPPRMLAQLLENGQITAQQAQWAAQIPVAQDLTAEGDSGGHTDNRPTVTLLPALLALRDRLQRQFGYACRLRVGAAGGMGTPASVTAAFAMGAAYVLTGSVNQACKESGSCDLVRQMLAQAEQADTIMAPSPDMFELGVKVQVLKRGTMFPMRAARLYEVFKAWPSLADIPAGERLQLEKQIFRKTFDEVWDETRQFFLARSPSHLQRAQADPKFKMALVFRWYLGLSSRWANAGDASRQLDYQVWCGPAMGAFNEWTKDTFLAEPQARDVETVALNLLYGSALLGRLNFLQCQGLELPDSLRQVAPLPLDQIKERLS